MERGWTWLLPLLFAAAGLALAGLCEGLWLGLGLLLLATGYSASPDTIDSTMKSSNCASMLAPSAAASAVTRAATANGPKMNTVNTVSSIAAITMAKIIQ